VRHTVTLPRVGLLHLVDEAMLSGLRSVRG
jgi:hypothetical protein